MDECQNYTVLRGADRAQGHVSQKNARCDQNELTPGRYRFQGAAGDRMPDKCVLMHRCGTTHPGWLRDGHPSVAEGAVTRTVCYNSYPNCCQWTNIINVRNCSGFYVYELNIARMPTCNLRYCGNGEGKLFWVGFLSVTVNI